MFRTEIKIVPSDLNLTLHDGVVTIGSCFAEVIGTKLKENKAPVLVNPFGTIFNPVSVASLLDACTGQSHFLEHTLLQREGIWYNYNLHSSISSPDKQKLLELMEQRISKTAAHIQTARLLIVTLGTAIGYQLAETGEVVANCHKLPAQLFNRNLIQAGTITESLSKAFNNLRALNQNLQIILTVSPVRHVKETLQLNSVSKATLLVACHALSEKHSYVSYFPAFEIMMDDLRDYRFYGQDMLHPTSVAEDYIWEKFMKAYYHPSFREFIQEWTKIKRATEHRPFHPDTPAHQTFIKNTLLQLDQLSGKYDLDITSEKDMLLQQLAK